MGMEERASLVPKYSAIVSRDLLALGVKVRTIIVLLCRLNGAFDAHSFKRNNHRDSKMLESIISDRTKSFKQHGTILVLLVLLFFKAKFLSQVEK